jgi:hypothetical protein
MKKLILSALLLFCLHPLFAQKLWEKVFSEETYNYSSYHDAAIFADSIILVSGMTNLLDCYTGLFSALSLSGEELWHHRTVDAGPECGQSNCYGMITMIAATENFIYARGLPLYGDVILGDEADMLYKFNPSGNLVFSAVLPGDAFHFEKTSLMIAHDEWGVIVSERQEPRLIKFDTDGNLLWEKEYDFQIDQIVFTENENFVIRTKDTLFVAAPSGALQDTFLLNEEVTSMVYLDQKIWLSSPGEVFSIDINTGERESILFIIPEQSFGPIKVFGNSLWLLSEDNHRAFVSRVGSEEPEHYTLPLPAFSIHDFFISNDTIILTGTYSGKQIAMIAWGMGEESPEVTWPDIEVADFEISNVEIIYVPGHDIVTGFRFDANITIRNNGNEPVEWFWLQSDVSGGFNCGMHYYYESFEKIVIQPGGEFSTGVIKMSDYSDPGVNTRLCFTAYAPNSLMEFNVSNNTLCKTFDLSDVSVTSVSSAFKVYPNPADQLLTIEPVTQGIYRVEIYSACGRLMISQTGVDELLTFDVSGFSAGMYFYRLYQGEKVETGKFVKR